MEFELQELEGRVPVIILFLFFFIFNLPLSLVLKKSLLVL